MHSSPNRIAVGTTEHQFSARQRFGRASTLSRCPAGGCEDDAVLISERLGFDIEGPEPFRAGEELAAALTLPALPGATKRTVVVRTLELGEVGRGAGYRAVAQAQSFAYGFAATERWAVGGLVCPLEHEKRSGLIRQRYQPVPGRLKTDSGVAG